MMDIEKIDLLATEIAKSYVGSKTMCTSSEFIELFLDVREAAKEIIIQRETKKNDLSDVWDNIPEDVAENKLRSVL